MEKFTPKQLGLRTYNILQKRKERTKKAQEKADREAKEILIESSLKARDRYYKSSRR